MNPVIIIPAHLGSKRLPNKPLLKVNGKPLIWYTYQNASQTPWISKGKSFNFIPTFVLTPDKAIIKECKRYNIPWISHSKSAKSGTERIKNYIDVFLQLEQFDTIINFQCDEVEFKDLDKVLRLHTPDGQITTPITHFNSFDQFKDLSTVKAVMDYEFNAMYFSREMIPCYVKGTRQEALDLCRRHIGVYIYPHYLLRSKFTFNSRIAEVENLEQLHFLFNKIKIRCVEVDHPYNAINTKNDYDEFKERMKDV